MNKKYGLLISCAAILFCVFLSPVSANSLGLIKGVAYSPHMPGEGCTEFGKANYTQDFEGMKQANVNTIRTYDQVPEEILENATKYGIGVIEGIWIVPEGDFSDESFKDECKTHIKEIIDRDKDKPCIKGWCIGNELDEGNVRYVGIEETEKFLEELYDYAKSLDSNSSHFVTHANWPPLDDLDLSFFDVISFNIFSYWPPKVANRGYYNYTRDLREKYPEKPLLVTEFGYSTSPVGPGNGGYGGNSEEEQAKLLKNCWEDIVNAGCTGGIVFEWNDEWWKNECYGVDKNTHNPDDPEEWFGMIAIEGTEDDYTVRKKRAYYMVQEIFGTEDFENVRDWNTDMGSQDGGEAYVRINQDSGWSGQALKGEHKTTTPGSWWCVFKTLNQNWSGWTRINFYYKEALGSGDISVAVKDADDEIWYAEVAQDNTDWNKVVINFTEFILDPWDHQGNRVLDLSNIQEIRFRHWPQRMYTGTFWVDELKLERYNITLLDNFENVDDWVSIGGSDDGGTGYINVDQDSGWTGKAFKGEHKTTSPGSWWYVYKTINQNWEDWDRIHFYYKEAPGSGDICVALVDDDFETWFTRLDQDNTEWENVTIDLSNFNQRDRYGILGDNTLDLFNIRQIRFRHWPARVYSGTFWVDKLEMERINEDDC
ncbi:MAG: hypothetical protein KAV40_00780 [Thermoplasmatales archaeon]|jgi:exo-beta-1,3-glucanase (GH17 family)|nr:hypothetical protein [Thermoplasmatales archaeon]